MIEKAIEFAINKHFGQLDKGGQPYILHCLRVMMAYPGHGDDRIAALLHDTIEDTDTTYEELEGCFGYNVAQIVGILTRGKDEKYEDYIYRIIHCHEKYRNAVLTIKKLDLEDNMNLSRLNRGLNNEDYQRFNKYLGVYKEICEVLNG